jgi:hypothetical protein
MQINKSLIIGLVVFPTAIHDPDPFVGGWLDGVSFITMTVIKFLSPKGMPD